VHEVAVEAEAAGVSDGEESRKLDGERAISRTRNSAIRFGQRE